MNTPRRPRYAAALFGAATLAASALTLLPGDARAQTAVTDPVGYLTIALPANSDTFVSIPFTRPAEFTGAVASLGTSGTAPNQVTNVLNLSGTPGFTAGAFAPLATTAPNDGHKTYYVIIGPKNAALTPTLSVTNGSNTVTASAAPEAVAGDTVTVAGYTFTVVSVSGATLTIDRVYPGTTATGLAATYDHSPSEGRFYTVTANDAGSLTVNLNGDSLNNVTAGTQVSVIPFWTLGTAFPATDSGKSFMTSASIKSRGTLIVTPDLTSAGVNLAPRTIYFNLNGGWRLVGDDPSVSHDDDLFLPDTYLIARNPATAPTNLAFTPTGGVPVNRLSVPLPTQTTTRQDVAVAFSRPSATTLNDTGLIISGAFKASPSLKSRADQLITYDNSQTGYNKGASQIYYYYNGGWRKVGYDVTVDYGTDIIPAGVGVTIRKDISSTGATSFLQNARNYLN